MIRYNHSNYPTTDSLITSASGPEAFASTKFSPGDAVPPNSATANSLVYISSIGTDSKPVLASTGITTDVNGKISTISMDKVLVKTHNTTAISKDLINVGDGVLDLSLSNRFYLTQANAADISFINAPAGFWTDVEIWRIQPGVDTEMAFNFPANTKFEGRVRPSYSYTANATDTIYGFVDGAGVFHCKAIIPGPVITSPRMSSVLMETRNTRPVQRTTRAIVAGNLVSVADDGNFYGTDVAYDSATGRITSLVTLDGNQVISISDRITALTSGQQNITLDLSVGSKFTLTQTSDVTIDITGVGAGEFAAAFILLQHDATTNPYTLTVTGGQLDRPMVLTNTADAVDLIGIAMRETTPFVQVFNDFGVPT